MFRNNMLISFKKKKALKSLCGVAIILGVFLSGHLASAEEVTEETVRPEEVVDTTSVSAVSEEVTEVVVSPEKAPTEPSTVSEEITEVAVSPEEVEVTEETVKPEEVVETTETVVSSEEVTTEPPAVSKKTTESLSAVSEADTTISDMVEETTVYRDGSKLTITYNNKMASSDSLAIAVWSNKNGQDDLIWHRSNTNSLVVDLAVYHKEYGLYNIHTYLNSNGKLVGRNARTFTVTYPKSPTVNVTKVADDKYDVIVSNLGKEISSIEIPTWSNKNGQDDLVWYGSMKTAEGTFTGQIQLKNHAYETNLYNIHVYGYSSITSKAEGLKAVQYIIPERTVTSSISLKDSASFSVSVSNVPTYIKEVLLPTWSNKNGQDDIVWYESTKTSSGFGQDISIKRHHYETGLYNIHVYGRTVDGQLIGLGTQTLSIPNPTVTTSVVSKGNNSYEVTVTDVPTYITSVLVPIWSGKGDQDDIVWNGSIKTSDTTYMTNFSLKDHQNNIGLYNIHVYGKTDKGYLLGLAGTTYIVKDLEINTTPKFSNGQIVEIQSFATHESNGTSLSHYAERIGTVYNIAKNTNNAIGGWEYHVKYNDGQENIHVLEQDLRFIYNVNLKEGYSKEQNNVILQKAFNYANTNKNITLYLPKGDFLIGSNIQESDLGKVSANEYIILSSDTKLRGNDLGTKLIVDGTMLWFGLPTGTRGIDGVSNLTLDNIHVQAKDLVNGDYFMIQLNHGNNITVKNSSFTMVQRKSRHIFDLGGVQNVTFKDNRFIGYAPSLTNVTSIPSGVDLHAYYSETIQIDASNNSGIWDASMIKNIASNAYMSYNSPTPILSSNIFIVNNQFLPFYNNGQLIAYSSTVGQHSSQVGNITVVGNRFEKTLSKRYNNNSWVMSPIHYLVASGYNADVRQNIIS